MASSYPGGFDALTNPAPSDPRDSPSLAGVISDANDAIEAVQATLGIDPQGGEADVVARLDAIDAAIAGLGGGAGGLELIDHLTFTTQAAATIDGAFDSTYDTYLILFDVTAQSASAGFSARLRASGTPATASQYSLHGNYGGAVGAGGISDNSAAQWGLSAPGAAGTTHGSFTIMAPALARATHITGTGWDSRGAHSAASGVHAAATAYDGITLYPASGTITGTLRIYGYQNS